MYSKLIVITDLDKKRANVQISLHLSQGKLLKMYNTATTFKAQ